MSNFPNVLSVGIFKNSNLIFNCKLNYLRETKERSFLKTKKIAVHPITNVIP